MTEDRDVPIKLPERATMADFQRYVHDLEAMHGWLDVDLVHNCFLMGEEVGELFKAVRRYGKMFEQGGAKALASDEAKTHVAEELVDVFNYLAALANRLDIDLEAAFVAKNEKNQRRTWSD
ncbi:MAG: MazG nucleotide pyrophosphohydrolase domain-containing protein [Deltaproteobacteria bacterium]